MQARTWTGRTGASGVSHRVIDIVTAAGIIAIVVLAVAAAIGRVPAPAALTVALLVPAAVVDVEQRRLPDIWVGIALAALIAASAIAGAVGAHVDVVGSFLGAAAMCLPILALHLASPASMGFGDVKVSLVLGAALGSIDWRLGVVALCAAALGGATTGLATRRRTIAFGAFVIFASWIVLLAHDEIVDRLFTGAGS